MPQIPYPYTNKRAKRNPKQASVVGVATAQWQQQHHGAPKKADNKMLGQSNANAKTQKLDAHICEVSSKEQSSRIMKMTDCSLTCLVLKVTYDLFATT